MSILVAFLAGFFSCAALVLVYGNRLVSQEKKKRLETLSKMKLEAERASNDMERVKNKLDKVKAIIDQQLDLQSGATRPSANASHSLYKNGLGAQIKQLEEEKIEIFKSILNEDKFDPTLTVLNAQGQQEKLKLSAYLEQMGIDFNAKAPEPEAPLPEGAKRRGKFLVYDGDK